MASRFALKRGDSFIANCIYKDADGIPVNLDTAGIEIVSKVRSPDGLTLFPLEVTIKDQVATPGGYSITGDTSSWPLGELSWDIRFNQAGQSFPSETIQFRVTEPIS
jgi:hypothetical protein